MQALWERHLCRQQRKRFAKGRRAGVLSEVVSTAGLCDEEEDKYISTYACVLTLGHAGGKLMFSALGIGRLP